METKIKKLYGKIVKAGIWNVINQIINAPRAKRRTLKILTGCASIEKLLWNWKRKTLK